MSTDDDDPRALTPLDGAHDTEPEQQPRMTPELALERAMLDLHEAVQDSNSTHYDMPKQRQIAVNYRLNRAARAVLAAYDAAKGTAHGR